MHSDGTGRHQGNVGWAEHGRGMTDIAHTPEPAGEPTPVPSVQPNVQPHVQPNTQTNVAPNVQPNTQTNVAPNVQPSGASQHHGPYGPPVQPNVQRPSK